MLSFAALALVAASSSAGGAVDVAARAVQVRDRALAGDSVAYDVLESLTTDVGARPVGSDGMTRAKDWGLATLKRLGFTNVHAEPFVKHDAWLRGAESAVLVAPYAMPLSVIALGNSVPTPAGGITGDVVVFKSLDALTAAAPGSLTGKIAVVNQPMTRSQSGEGYGAAVRVRGAGPALAAARGAVAFLTRSIATGTGRAPHTGATRYDAAIAKIPAAALGVTDADLLERLSKKGPVRLSLSLASTVIKDAPAWNVVGDVKGSAGDSDVVVIGGHLDSWDPGQGAFDDGCGVAITIAAAKLIAALPHTRRTVRVVLFGSEETGGSGEAFFEAHKGELEHISLTSESDGGPGPVFRVMLPGTFATSPAFAGLGSALAPVRTFLSRDAAADVGSDVEELEGAGVPALGLDPDYSAYFDIHHSADDTLDKVDRRVLDQSVAAWATTLAFVVDSDVDFRHPPPAPAP